MDWHNQHKRICRRMDVAILTDGNVGLSWHDADSNGHHGGEFGKKPLICHYDKPLHNISMMPMWKQEQDAQIT